MAGVPTPYYDDGVCQIWHGDCRDVLPSLAPVDAVVTSPPYAEQRGGQYVSVSESDYPEWTVDWMNRLPLAERGSVVINIRPHLRAGVLSDYVLRTRVALRAAGWFECEELIWLKPGGAGPFGSTQRPRRAWESLLWLGRSGDVWSAPKANGTPAQAFRANRRSRKGEGEDGYIGRRLDHVEEGVETRCLDVVSMAVGRTAAGATEHPAPFPVALAAWLTRLITPKGGTVLDPFMGGGSTLAAAKYGGYKAVGIDIDGRYCEIAARRLGQSVMDFGGVA